MKKERKALHTLFTVIASFACILLSGKAVFAAPAPKNLPQIEYTGTYSFDTQAEAEIIRLVNDLRKNPANYQTAAGMSGGKKQPVSNLYAAKPALSPSADIQQYARYKSLYMGAYQDFDHYYSKGPLAGVSSVSDIQFFNSTSFGENIAMRSAHVQGKQLGAFLFQQWLDSAGHLGNMMSSNNTFSAGVAIVSVGNAKLAYATQQFGLAPITPNNIVPNPLTTGATAPSAVKPTSMAIIKNPAKTSYKIGEKLNLAGGSVRVKYSDGKQADLPMTDKLFQVSGFQSEKAGTVTVKVAIEIPAQSVSLSQNFVVTVEGAPSEGENGDGGDNGGEQTPDKKEVSDISLHTLPTKTTYQLGEKLNLQGAQAKVTYADETSEIISLVGKTAEGFDGSITGEQTVSVLVDDATLSKKIWTLQFKVNVVKSNATDTTKPEPDTTPGNTTKPGTDNKDPQHGAGVQTGDTTNVLFAVSALFISAFVVLVSAKKRKQD